MPDLELTGSEPDEARGAVLLVDDDKAIRNAGSGLLVRSGFTVKTVADGPAAEAALKSSKFDAVVLDLCMPNPGGEDNDAGFDVLERVTKLSPRPAAVILTAYDSAQNTLKALERGADALVPKVVVGDPTFWITRLPTVLTEVLGRRRAFISDKDVEKNVREARKLQTKGFPKNLLSTIGAPGLTIAGGNLPAVWVSGDNYDFHPLDSSRIAFMLCDAVRHGVSAALAAMHLRAIFRLGMKLGWPLADIDVEMHESLRSFNPDDVNILSDDDETYATGVIGVLDIKSRWIELLVAWHPMPSIVPTPRATDPPEVKRRGDAWGTRPVGPPQVDGFRFGPGQSVVFYSDGLSELNNADDNPFGAGRIHEAHLGFCNSRTEASNWETSKAEELCDHVLYEAVKFAGGIAPRQDDLTILAIHWAATV